MEAATSEDRIFFVEYSYVPDVEVRRQGMRDAHLAYMENLIRLRKLGAASPFVDPVDGALLVLAGESEGAAMEIVAHDPYFVGGLVRSVRVREIMPVIGGYSGFSTVDQVADDGKS